MQADDTTSTPNTLRESWLKEMARAEKAEAERDAMRGVVDAAVTERLDECGVDQDGDPKHARRKIVDAYMEAGHD